MHETYSTMGKDQKTTTCSCEGRCGMCAECTRTPDNKYFECPAKMEDGRIFTDYRPRCIVQSLRSNCGIQLRSHDQRQMLIQNAGNMLMNAMRDANAKAKCGPCAHPSTMLPEAVMQACDARSCAFVSNPVPKPAAQSGPVYKSGIGRLHEYGSSSGSGYEGGRKRNVDHIKHPQYIGYLPPSIDADFLARVPA